MAQQQVQNIEFPAIIPAINTRVSRQRLQPGELSLGVGLDGRFIGSLRKFPGFAQLLNLDVEALHWFKYVSMTKGASTSAVLRGFLVHSTTEASTSLRFHFYEDDAWDSFEITGFTLDTTSQLDADGNGRFVYITCEGQDPLTFYHTGTAFAVKSMGCTAEYANVDPPEVSVSDTGGYLPAGSYQIGYRYYDSVRRVFSALGRVTVTVAPATNTASVAVTPPTGATPFTDGFDKLYVYRSLSVEIADTLYDAGVLWNESIVDLVGDSWTATVGTLDDTALLYQDPYEASEDAAGVPPQSAALCVYEGMTLLGSDTTENSIITELHFSPLSRYTPETFPVGNVYRWSIDDGPVLRFVRCGDVVYAWTASCAFRIAKLGSQMTITRVNGGRGLASRYAVSSIGRDMLVLSPSGLLLADGSQGSMQVLGAADRRIRDDWAGELHTAYIVTDHTLGATFVVNTQSAEAVVLWHVTGGVTELEDVVFPCATEGVDPITGTSPRAFFATSTGRIVYASDSANNSMFGFDPFAVTVNGEASADSDPDTDPDILVDEASIGWSTAALQGAVVYIWPPNATTPQRAVVKACDVNLLQFTAPLSPPVVAGSRYTIAPVPFRVRMWPLNAPSGDMQDFGRRVVTAIGVRAVNFAGDATAAQWALGVCRNLADTPAALVAATFTDDPDDTTDIFKPLAADGWTVEPYIEHIQADSNFELLSVLLTGRMVVNRQSG